MSRSGRPIKKPVVRRSSRDSAPRDASALVDATCSVCLEARPVQGAHHCRRCDTRVCHSCFRSYLIYKIDASEVVPHQLVCPGSCRQPILREIFVPFLPRQYIHKYTVALEAALHRRRGQRFCPRPECGQELASSGKSKRRVDCESCRHVSCRDCGGAYHMWPQCHQEYRSWCRAHGARRCPSCSAIVEKDGGCNHIQCTYCQHEFCWRCRVQWLDHNVTLCPVHTLRHSQHWCFGPAPLRCITKIVFGAATVLVGTLATAIILPLAIVYVGIDGLWRRHRAPRNPARGPRTHIDRPPRVHTDHPR